MEKNGRSEKYKQGAQPINYTITRTFGVGALAAATGMSSSKLYGIDLCSSCKMPSRPCECQGKN